MYLVIAILCLAIAPGTFCYEDIHKYMSEEEVQHMFNTDTHSVPKYEVVELHVSERLHKRSLPAGSHFYMRAFGQNINLWLHPRDSILAGVDTPVYYAKSSGNAPQGVEYNRQHGLMAMVGRIYEDPRKMASLVIGREESGRSRVNGYIGAHKLAVRSLPKRVVDEYVRRRRSVDNIENSQNSSYHVVIKMNENSEEIQTHSPVNETKLQRRSTRSATAVPDILYPEILVVVENSVYKAFQRPEGHDIYALLEYILAFWNGVDLKYRSIETPRFRFHISAIVLAVDPQATPYISKNMVSMNAFDTNKAMPQSKSFYYEVKDTFDLDSYDVAATMTIHDFGIGSPILGQAWPGSACQRSDDERTIDAVTIYKDDGAFGGMHNIAHELGHVFGAGHDPSTERCVYSYGFLMAPTPWYTTNSSDFSPCSLDQFQKGLDDGKLTCLYNQPHRDGQNLPKVMPGRMKNLEAQCKIQKGGSSCQNEHPEHSVCVNMFCYNEEGECVETGAAALDGTECGDNKFCLHNQCVRL